MEQDLVKFFSILVLTMLKFMVGPIGGYVANFSLIKTITVTIIGMMSSVTLFTYLGVFLQKNVFNHLFKKRRKKFSKRSRRLVSIWKKYGVFGTALLTPLFLTPIGGTLLLVSFRTPKLLIMICMLVSAVIWSIILSSLMYLLGDEVLNFINYSTS